MGEISRQMMGEIRLPLLPGWEGYDEAIAGVWRARLKAVEYFDSLKPEHMDVLARARGRDIFAGARSGRPDAPALREWFLTLVESHEGCLEWAVECAQEMADGKIGV